VATQKPKMDGREESKQKLNSNRRSAECILGKGDKL
jgi:hypothetical protein